MYPQSCPVSDREAWHLYLAGEAHLPLPWLPDSSLAELVEERMLTLDFDDLVREQVSYQLAVGSAQTLPTNRQLYEREQYLRCKIRKVWEGSSLGLVRDRRIRGVIERTGDIIFDRRLAAAESRSPEHPCYKLDPYRRFSLHCRDDSGTDAGIWAGLRAQLYRGLNSLLKPSNSKEANSRTRGLGSGRHSQPRPTRSMACSDQDKSPPQKASLQGLPTEILLQINREHLLEQDLEPIVHKYIQTRARNRVAILRAHEQPDQRFGNANRRHVENDLPFWNEIWKTAGLATASHSLFNRLHRDVVATVDKLITANQDEAMIRYDRLRDDDHIRGTEWSMTPRWDNFWTKQCSLLQEPTINPETGPVRRSQIWSRPPAQKSVMNGRNCRLTGLPQPILDRIIDDYLGLLLFDYMDYTASEIWNDTINIGSKTKNVDNWVLSMLFWNSVWKSATLRLTNRMFNLQLQDALPEKVSSCMPDYEFRVQCAELTPDDERAQASSLRTRQLSDLPWLLMWHEITPSPLNQAIYRYRRIWMISCEASEDGEPLETQFLPMVAQTHAVVAGRRWEPCNKPQDTGSMRIPRTYKS